LRAIFIPIGKQRLLLLSYNLEILRLVKINCFTVEQRVVIVKNRSYYKYGESSLETLRKLRTIFDRQNVSDLSTIRRIIKKFEESGSGC